MNLIFSVAAALALCMQAAGPQESTPSAPAQLLFVDLHGVQPLLYIDDKLVFAGKVPDSNDGTGLDFSLELPLRGRHKVRLITDRGDRTQTLDISEDMHVILLSRHRQNPIRLVHEALLD